MATKTAAAYAAMNWLRDYGIDLIEGGETTAVRASKDMIEVDCCADNEAQAAPYHITLGRDEAGVFVDNEGQLLYVHDAWVDAETIKDMTERTIALIDENWN